MDLQRNALEAQLVPRPARMGSSRTTAPRRIAVNAAVEPIDTHDRTGHGRWVPASDTAECDGPRVTTDFLRHGRLFLRFRPSMRYRRSVRLWLTSQLSRRSSKWIRGDSSPPPLPPLTRRGMVRPDGRAAMRAHRSSHLGIAVAAFAGTTPICSLRCLASENTCAAAAWSHSRAPREFVRNTTCANANS